MTRTAISTLLALVWAAFALMGAISFERGEWVPALAVWGIAGMVYMTWKGMR